MALDHGRGVSRTLSPQDRAFGAVIWQKGKPPLDSEMNLMSSVDWERFRQYVSANMPSGFFLDPTRSEFDYKFQPNWINHFQLGAPRTPNGTHDGPEQKPVLWANVNGWIVPVAGTDITEAEGVHNLIKLYPPPESDLRVDLVFLEVWQTLVQPNPSLVNKPTASTIWKYGNVKHGGTNITDDLEDPTIGVETTKRVQIQYRIRVHGSGVGSGSGVNITSHPDGLDDPNILGQGTQNSPIAGLQWTNMREELGDPSLWRAGNGDPNNTLGTVDGYTYAIPICAVFRRNSGTYVAQKASGNPNQNGAFLRRPGAKLLPNPLNGAVALLEPVLGAYLSPSAGVSSPTTIAVTNLNGCGLEDSSLILSNTFLRIGSEIIGISAVNLSTGMITIPAGGRGRWGTARTGHDAGTAINFFNTRPDGRFADEIASTDVLDLRRSISTGDWDYNRILAHNVGSLAKGTLRTAWKMSNPGDTAGPVIHEVSDLYAANETHPNHSEPVDGPDGIRTIWSDAITIQPDVTLLLDHEASRDSTGSVGFTNGTFDATVEWDVGADFKPVGFLNRGTGGVAGWTNGSSVHLFIGGADGNGGARGTFRSSGVNDVRFVTPQEFWKTGYPTVAPSNGNQHPVTVRFLGEKAYQAPPSNLTDNERAKYGGPLYPWREDRFERPFIVLGGLLHNTLRETSVNVSNLGTFTDEFGNTRYTLDLTGAGLNFDDAGVFYPASGLEVLDPGSVSVPLLRGERTLFGMLTNDGSDQSGASSEVYLLTFGDPSGVNNNGAFRVIGAGTVGYTEISGSTPGMLVLEPLSADFTGWSSTGSGSLLTVDFRSQYHNADDISNYNVASRQADLVVVLTDIGGESLMGTPWDLSVAGNLALPQDGGNANKRTAASKMVLNLTLMYHPGRAGMARVPDEVVRFAMRGGSENTLGSYLRRSPSSIDTTFSAIGTATDETYWPPIHVQTWNRLSGLGWHAPLAPAYGGSVVGFTESEREHELFIDRGSKTVLFRPFRNRDMTLKALTWSELPGGQSLMGSYTYPDLSEKDSLQILTGTDGVHGTTGKRMGFVLPQEFAPRFGRQDIPYRVLNTGSAPTSAGFMPGINHLFTDVTDLTNPVFNIIGGEANSGGTEVNPLFFLTRSTEVGYAQPNSNYGPKGVGVYGARKTTDIDPNTGASARAVIASLAAVNSSDLGRGLKGIQLPPYVGIARLYGVYEYRDYQAKGGTTYKSNRYEMEADAAINLLREDADQQTLFILQNGAQDYTESLNDHTYIIPSNVLDLTRVPASPGNHAGYVSGETQFEDFDYVVEATVFFFAQGFINKNNIVLVRKRNGSFGLNTDGSNPELENVPMCIPSPAGVNDRLYAAYNRTVYQGDPYMTRDGATRQDADYENRYGSLTPNQAWLLRTAIQQFDSAGNFVPQRANDRGFEVLASMDFYTTLGTGKIGGALYPGTSLDVGYVGGAPSRMPLVENARPWRVEPRAFSEGQKNNSSRASATLEVLSNLSLVNACEGLSDTFTVQIGLLDGGEVILYGATSALRTTLIGAPHNIPSEDVFVLDQTSTHRESLSSNLNLNFGALDDGEVQAVTTTIANVRVGDGVVVTPRATYSGIRFYGYVSSNNTVTVVAHNENPNVPFASLSDNDSVKSITVTVADLGAVASGTSTAVSKAFVGASIGSAVVVNTPSIIAGLAVTADPVTVSGQVVLRFHNYTGAPVSLAVDAVLTVAVLVERPLGSVNLNTTALDIRVSQTQGSNEGTAANLASTLNAHSQLQRTLKATPQGSKVLLEAVPVGVEGNGVRVTLGRVNIVGAGVGTPLPLPLAETWRLSIPNNNTKPVGFKVTSTYLFGGVDLPVNAGDGTNQVALTGMTERFPLGVLVQDSDFICENPLGDSASAMNSTMSGLRPIQTLMPLTNGGEEYTRFMGAPGELVALADVQIAPYSWAAWTEESPDGASRKYRIYRGGGAAFVLGGENPGGPLDWVSESFPKSDQAILKSGVLACRALLVRNFYEEALSGEGNTVQSQGDEVQMVLLTYAHLGQGLLEEGLALNGIISPSGYGEGYAAADRYRCMGRPMIRGYSRDIPNPSEVVLAVYPEDERGE